MRTSLLFLAALLSVGGARAAGTDGAGLFQRPTVLRGTLGQQQVQARVQPKPAPDDGLEGEYFLFGASRRILLAGEVDEDQVFMEESANGIDVSGVWEGTREGDTFRGTWRSADQEQVLPFLLKEVKLPSSQEKARER